MGETLRLGPVESLVEGAATTVEAFGSTVAVFNVGGRFYAVDNRCPHHGGPLCAGRVGGAVLSPFPGRYALQAERPVLSCPWHHWEFYMDSGESLFDARVRVPAFDVTVQEGELVLHVRAARG